MQGEFAVGADHGPLCAYQTLLFQESAAAVVRDETTSHRSHNHRDKSIQQLQLPAASTNAASHSNSKCNPPGHHRKGAHAQPRVSLKFSPTTGELRNSESKPSKPKQASVQLTVYHLPPSSKTHPALATNTLSCVYKCV